MKTYRCFIDVKAENKELATAEARDVLRNNPFRIQEDPFDDYEEGIILELARMALSDAEVYDEFAGKMDISDKELKKLQKKIEGVTNRE